MKKKKINNAIVQQRWLAVFVIKDKAFERRTEALILAFLFFTVFEEEPSSKTAIKDAEQAAIQDGGSSQLGCHRHSTSGYKRCSKSGWREGGGRSSQLGCHRHSTSGYKRCSKSGMGGGGGEKQPARMPQAQHIRIQEMQQVRMEGGGGGRSSQLGCHRHSTSGYKRCSKSGWRGGGGEAAS